MPLSPRDREDLAFAAALLEHPSLAATLTATLGAPIERALTLLPEGLNGLVQRSTRAALERALEVAFRTLDGRAGARGSRDGLHRALAAASGGLAGGFGLPALAFELPLSTVLMLRSIADVARSEGEDLERMDARLACLEVFALGGRSRSDDASETGYFAVRASLAVAVSDALRHLAAARGVERSAPALVNLIGRLAARFGVAVSEKAAAQSVPVIGAVGGALVNTLFIDHFQGVARGHFIVRRLEREHGAEAVRAEYERARAAG